MNTRKVFWVVAAAVIVLALGVFGAAYQADKLLKHESDKLVNLKLQGKLLDEEQSALVQANKDIENYSELESIAKTVVPQDKDQARTVREISKIASDNGIKLGSITFPTSTLGNLPAAPTTPSTTGTSDSSNASSQAQAQATPTVTQVKPVTGIPGVYTMEITIQSDSNNPTTYANFVNFLKQLERNRRTAHVTTVTVEPHSENRQLIDFTLLVNVYLKP